MLDDSAAIHRRLLPLDRVGKTLHLAAVARGGEAGNSKPEAIELAGNDLKPYAPVHLAASGSFGADITLSWVRRTRVGGDLQDGFGTVLLAEDTEEYEIEILGPDDDVRRTVTGLTSPTFTYTAAMQAEDFPEGYPASAFVVYQISAQVGRGFAARFDFPDAPQLTTLGETIAEGQAGSAASAFEAAKVMAQRYDGISGQVLSASAYLGSSATGNMRIGLYADDAGEPGALLATTEEKAVHRHQLGALGGVHVHLAAHDGRGRQVLARLPHRRERQQPGLRRRQPERWPSPDQPGLRQRPARSLRLRQLVFQHPRHAPCRLDQPMTNNLDLAQVAPSQNNKETTINDQAGQLDAALTEVLTIEVDDSNAYVLTDSEFRRSFFIVVTEGSPAPTAAIAVQAPAIRRGLFKLLNLDGPDRRDRGVGPVRACAADPCRREPDAVL